MSEEDMDNSFRGQGNSLVPSAAPAVQLALAMQQQAADVMVSNMKAMMRLNLFFRPFVK